MEISRKTDYAIRMLAELVRSNDAVISVRYAAEKNGVPYSFARSIQHDLVQAGIVASVRGSRGGMKLAVDPRRTTVCQIIEAIQGPICVAECDTGGPEEGPCPFRQNCSFSAVWCEAERMLRDYFDAVTLYQIVIEGRCPYPRNGHDYVVLTPGEHAALAEGTPTEE
ncbi:MAG: Rrf2 family transcriptional regulator [Coriobacteriales bacterium]|jgi:Rrf2 family protein|nr:Rrf2 family transcriptional regulator [Coriobacteriales bacterium]